MEILMTWAIGLAAASFAMYLTWKHVCKTGNAGFVDVVWTFSLGGLALLYAFFIDGWWVRNFVVAGVVMFWSLRLGLHIYKRYKSEPEDGRYAALKEKWGDEANKRMLNFYFVQAGAASLLSVAFIAAMLAPEQTWTIWDTLACLVALLSVVGEGIADQQLRRFKENPENKGKTCRDGLWAYSRHPNYFFEWTYWLAFPLFAFSSGYIWLAVLSPIILYYFITQKTGIPPTEEQALKSRPVDYKLYQEQVSPFFPWFPKKSAR